MKQEITQSINLKYRPISRLSMDLKVMPKSYQGHNFILFIIDVVTNYLITVPVHQSRVEQIGNALIDKVISKYCIPDYILMDQESAFMLSLMNYLLMKTDISI